MGDSSKSPRMASSSTEPPPLRTRYNAQTPRAIVSPRYIPRYLTSAGSVGSETLISMVRLVFGGAELLPQRPHDSRAQQQHHHHDSGDRDAPNEGRGHFRELGRRAVGLQSRHQRLQLAESDGVGGGGHPLTVLLHRQLALRERRVE